MCCNGVCALCGTSKRVYARIGYVLFSAVWIAACFVMLHYGAKMFPVLRYFLSCPPDSSTYDTCVGIFSVYRISFSLCVFHFVMAFLCLFQNELIAALNEGAWPFKFIFVGGIFILTYFIPDSFFTFYGHIATVASILFLLYEVILLIDMAYAWNKSWTDQYSASESNAWGTLLIATTAIIYVGGVILLLRWISAGNERWITFNLLFTLICALVSAGLSMSRVVENGSLLTCALIFGVNVVMCGSLLASTAGKESWACLILVFAALVYVSSTTVSEEEDKNLVKSASAKVMETEDKYENPANAEVLPEITMATGLYHILLAFAAMYYGMLLTNWGGFTTNGDDFSSGKFGVGVRLVSQWVANALFIWSLIAPRVFPDRDFS